MIVEGAIEKSPIKTYILTIYIFDLDIVWRIQLMIIKGKIRVVCVGYFEPLMLIN